jgi:hypothetical protein
MVNARPLTASDGGIRVLPLSCNNEREDGMGDAHSAERVIRSERKPGDKVSLDFQAVKFQAIDISLHELPNGH